MAWKWTWNTPWSKVDGIKVESWNWKNPFNLLQASTRKALFSLLTVLQLATVWSNVYGADKSKLDSQIPIHQIDEKRKKELKKQLDELRPDSEERQIAFLNTLLWYANYENHPKWSEWDKEKQKRLKEYTKRQLVTKVGLVFFNPSDEHQKSLFRYLVRSPFFNHREAFWTQENGEKIISSLFKEHGDFINTYSPLALEYAAMVKIALHQEDKRYAEIQNNRKKILQEKSDLAKAKESLAKAKESLAKAKESLAKAKESLDKLKNVVEKRKNRD